MIQREKRKAGSQYTFHLFGEIRKCSVIFHIRDVKENDEERKGSEKAGGRPGGVGDYIGDDTEASWDSDETDDDFADL